MVERHVPQLGLSLRPARFVAGIDEAGRGPLAGPVVAAAVIFDPSGTPDDLDDSKRLSESKREALDLIVRAEALAWSIAWADPGEIDALNILGATMLAMQRAVRGLRVEPRYALVDGNRLPRLDCPGEAVIGGDATVAEISAASILAKVFRDRYMVAADRLHPGYGFAQHKGYPTERHLEALAERGPCILHRRSFGPVAECSV